MVSHRADSDDAAGGARILDAATATMADVGPSRMTVAEVARRAGVSRMTVYRHYEGLAELTSAVLTAEIAAVVARTGADAPALGSARQRLVAETVAVVAALNGHSLLQRVLQVDPQSLLPLLVQRIGSGQRMLRDRLAARAALGMASLGGDGSIRDADPQLIGLTVLTIAQPFVVGMAPLRGLYPEDELLAELATAVDGYLRSDRGPTSTRH